MHTYDPLLTGELNIYNVGLAVLTTIGLVVVGSLLLGAWRQGPGLRTVRGFGLVLDCLPLGLGAVAFALLALIDPIEPVPGWGAFYLLPAAFLAAVAVLTVVRPVHAGVVLAGAAAAAFLSQIALGFTAGRIDPAWVADGMDQGSLAVITLVFSLPAMVTAIVLLTRGAPAFEAP
jgi:hypothetical protein